LGRKMAVTTVAKAEKLRKDWEVYSWEVRRLEV
jgi:hypothetical protein